MATCDFDIHEGDVGTPFIITITDCDGVVNISTATELKIYFLKPDRTTTLTKTAALYTDGTDGKLSYTSIADDLTPAGNWRIQGYVKLPSGEWSSEIEDFYVAANLV